MILARRVFLRDHVLATHGAATVQIANSCRLIAKKYPDGICLNCRPIYPHREQACLTRSSMSSRVTPRCMRGHGGLVSLPVPSQMFILADFTATSWVLSSSVHICGAFLRGLELGSPEPYSTRNTRSSAVMFSTRS